jgi:hypothetical protein
VLKNLEQQASFKLERLRIQSKFFFLIPLPSAYAYSCLIELNIKQPKCLKNQRLAWDEENTQVIELFTNGRL